MVKYFIRISLLLFLMFFILVSLLFAANAGKLNGAIKTVLNYYIEKNNLDISFEDFSLKDSVILFNNVGIGLDEFRLLSDSLTIRVDYISFLQWKLNSSILENNFKFIDKNKIEILSANYHGNYNIDSGNSEFKILSHSQENNNFNFYLNYQKNSKEHKFNLSTKFLEKHFIDINNEGDKIFVNLSNIPLTAYSLFKRNFSEHPLYVFFDGFIRDGTLVDGFFIIDSKKKYPEMLKGKAKIDNLEISYDYDLPYLKNMDVNLEIDGSQYNFYINKGYSTTILLHDGHINMLWKGKEKTILDVDLKAVGPVSGLVDFINIDTIENLKKADINLYDISGEVVADVKVKIPLKKDSKNHYDINAKIPNSSISILSGNVNFTDIDAIGNFNGDHLTIYSKGKVNGYDSDLDFVYNFIENKNFDHRLNIKTKIIYDANNPEKQKLSFLDINKGKSELDFEYINIEDKGYIKSKIDLTNLDLGINKFSFNKPQNIKSYLLVNGTFLEPTSGNIELVLDGNKNYKIKTNIDIKEDITKINIKDLSTPEISLKDSVISNEEKRVLIDLYGKYIDLSKINIFNLFSEGDNKKKNTSIIGSFTNVKLKNDIDLDDVVLNFECDTKKCYNGFLDSKIKNKNLSILLDTKDDVSKWVLSCGDAGSLLKSMGMYDKLKGGNLDLSFNKDLNNPDIGVIGDFKLNKFSLSNKSFIAKLVSSTSVPGLLSTISGSDNIMFSNMSGNFDIKNNIITIRDSYAEGVFFDFFLKGNIDTGSKKYVFKGYVKPELYGISSVVGYIPVIGNIFNGRGKKRGLSSLPYKIEDSY